jgi:hypothetical protein
MLEHALDFLRGATMMAELGIAVFLFKYWKETSDRLFIFFSVAFVILAISQKVVFIFGDRGEFAPYAYYMRLAAFILILLGILEKNLPKHKATEKPK